MAKAILNGQTIFGNVHLGHGGSNMHDYSTDEQIVGTWIDGKTLYEKTVSVTIANESAQTLVTIAGAEYKQIEGFISSGSGVVPVPFHDGTSLYVPYTDSDDVKLAKSNASQGVGNTLILTIRYTKSST